MRLLPGRHREVGGGGGITEDQARAALASFDGAGGPERWIAEQRWDVVPGGWVVPEPFGELCFRVEPVAGGVRATAFPGGGEPPVWDVPAVGEGRGKKGGR